MSHFIEFHALVQLQWNKHLTDEVYASFYIEETLGSTHGCSVNVIAEAELTIELRTYSNV